MRSPLFFAAAAAEDPYSTMDVLLYALLGIVVVLSILSLLYGAITLMSKAFDKQKKEEAAAIGIIGGADGPTAIFFADEADKPQGAALAETESQGKLTLIDTDEATAAILMAIISERSGIPLNHLEFRSIRCLGPETEVK